MSYDDYMGEINENEISDANMRMDEISLGKKQMPVKLHIRKQEVIQKMTIIFQQINITIGIHSGVA